jgi:CheY-like chemotaxis protein
MQKKILLVDDSSTTRVLHRTLITQETNYTVQSATDGMDAMQKALAEKPDLILMDVMMPKMSGLEVCRLLRENERTKSIPIVLLTHRTGEEDAGAGFKSGCNEYLAKPVSGPELLGVLRKYLD